MYVVKIARLTWVETAGEPTAGKAQRDENVGITAGASTPASIIKEVLATMSEIKENTDPVVMEDNADSSFAEIIEESLKSLNTDEKVRGVVVGIAPNEIYVDVGRKQAGLSRFPSFHPTPTQSRRRLSRLAMSLTC